MMFLERSTACSVRSRFYRKCFTNGLSVGAIAVLTIAAVLSLLAFIDTSFIQIDDAHKPISSALFFSDSTIDNHDLPRFYGYQIALLYDFGNQLAQSFV